MSTEQWKTNGRYTECRRNSYCNKPCKPHIQNNIRQLSQVVTEAVVKTLVDYSKEK